MTKFTEGRYPGEGLMSEANFHRSRETVTIKSGSGVIKPGTILGKVTSGGEYAPSPNAETAGIEGAETALCVALYGCDATSASAKIAVIARDAEWNVNTLTYDASVNDNTKKAAKHTQLKAVGIIVR